MDNINDDDARQIFDRLKKYIDVDKLKGKNQEEIQQEIENQLRQIRSSESRGKSGNVGRLLKAGFPKKVAEFLRPKAEMITIRQKEYSKKDLRIKESFWRGKKAEYISDAKTGKRITWRLIT